MHRSSAGSPKASGGSTLLRRLKWLFLATRPLFFPASVLPVLVGTSWGWRSAGALDLPALALALAAVLWVHAGANVLNDVFDDLKGADRDNDERIFPYTGGSRLIQNGILTAREMALWGAALLALGALFGAALAARKGGGVLLFGLAGIALGTLYTLPPVQLSYRGLGEAAVGIGFGVLPVLGAAWLQSGELSLAALVLSLPVAFWVTAVLLINEVPDRRADRAAGKMTLVVRLGPDRTRRLYLLLQALALGATLAAVAMGVLPALSLLLPVLLTPVAAHAARGIGATTPRLKRSIELTLMIHALGALWLSGWVLAPL